MRRKRKKIFWMSFMVSNKDLKKRKIARFLIVMRFRKRRINCYMMRVIKLLVNKVICRKVRSNLGWRWRRKNRKDNKFLLFIFNY